MAESGRGISCITCGILPFELVRFHAEFMTLYPGDLISTGCPKGARIKAGDRVRARIDGVGALAATVHAG
jgi:2-keto-4-pentenoate hydratase/2-oxohepta-3-ene-1,7-dioic acid hydratase in catechol pathway